MKKTFVALYFYLLRNETYVEFHKSFCTIVNRIGAGSLGITSLYNDVYKPLLQVILAILDFIKKSPLTRQIEEKDHARDGISRGLAMTVKALTRHPDPAKRAAAERLDLIITHYGNVPGRIYVDETAAIDDMLVEFDLPENKAFAATAGVTDWIEQLRAANREFAALMDARNVEISKRPEARMQEARAALDEAFQSILDRVEAQITLYGLTSASSDYAPFVHEYNTLVEYYLRVISTQKGRNARKNEEGEEL
jgi:hypothetical protein